MDIATFIQSPFEQSDSPSAQIFLNIVKLGNKRKIKVTNPIAGTHVMAPLMVLPQSGFMVL